MYKKLAAIGAIAALTAGAAVAGPSASNFKPENKLGPNYWNAKSAIDNNLETAWQVPGDSANAGEWVMLDVPAGTVDKIAIFPGWGASEEIFADYARVKEIKVEVFCCTGDEKMTSLYTGTFPVQDKAELQLIDVEDTRVGNDLGMGGKVKFTVTAFYEGRDFPNLAVSEILVHLKPYDAVAEIDASLSDDGTNILPNMQDDNPMTYWAGPADSTITFEASGYGVSGVLIQPGPATHARPKRVKVTANDKVLESTLENNANAQYVPVPSIMGYTGSAWGEISVEILEVYPGSVNAEVAIAEFKAQATSYDGF